MSVEAIGGDKPFIPGVNAGAFTAYAPGKNHSYVNSIFVKDDKQSETQKSGIIC